MHEIITAFTAGPGGVCTDEVGVITGDLELGTRCADDGSVTVSVRYAETADWYRIAAADCTLTNAADHPAFHRALLGLLHRPNG